MIRSTILSIALLLIVACLGTASAAGKETAVAVNMKKIDLGKFDADNPFSEVVLEISPNDADDARALQGIERMDKDEEDADILNEMANRRERMLKKFTAKVRRNCRRHLLHHSCIGPNAFICSSMHAAFLWMGFNFYLHPFITQIPPYMYSPPQLALFQVTRKGKSKKCRCNASSVSKCKRCLGACCHDLGNGTRRCRHYATNTCRKLWGKSSKGSYKKKKRV